MKSTKANQMKFANEKKNRLSGSAGIGNISFVMKPISSDMSNMFTIIR